MSKKQTPLKEFSTIIECNGIDKNYHIEHMLNSKSLIVQVIDEETGITIKDLNYSIKRDTENTILVTFSAPPITRKKFLVLCLSIT